MLPLCRCCCFSLLVLVPSLLFVTCAQSCASAIRECAMHERVFLCVCYSDLHLVAPLPGPSVRAPRQPPVKSRAPLLIRDVDRDWQFRRYDLGPQHPVFQLLWGRRPELRRRRWRWRLRLTSRKKVEIGQEAFTGEWAMVAPGTPPLSQAETMWRNAATMKRTSLWFENVRERLHFSIKEKTNYSWEQQCTSRGTSDKIQYFLCWEWTEG